MSSLQNTVSYEYKPYGQRHQQQQHQRQSSNNTTKMIGNLNKKKEMSEMIECNGVTISNPWKQSVEVKTDDLSISVHFDNIHNHFIETIKSYGYNQIIVGCIAWLSNPKFITTLADHCKHVFIIVNNEDYTKWGNGKTHLLYNQLPISTLPMHLIFSHLNTPLNTLETHIPNHQSSEYAPVRACGNPGGKGAIMHSKYLVFFKNGIPDGVLTGSANYTKRSICNQENVLCIKNKHIAMGYFNDFSSTFMQSQSIGNNIKQSNYYNNSKIDNNKRW